MTFTEGSPLQCTDVPHKEKVHGSVPNNSNDCILGDLLSPRSSWEQGWHVSVVAVTIKKEPVLDGNKPSGNHGNCSENVKRQTLSVPAGGISVIEPLCIQLSMFAFDSDFAQLSIHSARDVQFFKWLTSFAEVK